MRFREYILVFITVVFAVIMVLLGFLLIGGRNSKNVAQSNKPTKFDITLECEKISSLSTNEY